MRLQYYAEIGHDESFADRLTQEVGVWATYLYWTPAADAAVKRISGRRRVPAAVLPVQLRWSATPALYPQLVTGQSHCSSSSAKPRHMN